ncbi:hypothetical protein OG783_33235 [Streptomyces jietaisiensis]|uniref:hypothetical protein n=1 Tax=Streptomyces griseoaurantiacus TaxID=68213 RepID=UPI00324524D8
MTPCTTTSPIPSSPISPPRLSAEAAGHLANGGSARLTALLHRGRALLAAPDRAEHQFPAALAGVVVGAVAF